MIWNGIKYQLTQMGDTAVHDTLMSGPTTQIIKISQISLFYVKTPRVLG